MSANATPPAGAASSASAAAAGGGAAPADDARAKFLAHADGFFAKEAETARKFNYEDYVPNRLPLTRVKNIMRSDPDVRMIATEAPIVFAKAAELFVADLCMRTWADAAADPARQCGPIRRADVARTIARAELFDFLRDVVPVTAADAPAAAAAGAGAGAAGRKRSRNDDGAADASAAAPAPAKSARTE